MRLLFLLTYRFLAIVFVTARALAHVVLERAAEVWPIAFPLRLALYRGQGVRLSREDAKPLARRIRDYRVRVIARSATPYLPRLVAA